MVNIQTKNSLPPAIISSKPLSFVELVHTIKMELSKKRNKQLTQTARVLLLHGMRKCPQMVDQMFWPFAIKAAAERMNSLHIDTDGHTPESKFYGVNIENIPVKTFHTMFCPCYILDSRLHNAGSTGLLKWDQDLTLVYILDTLHFTPEVFHLSTTHPLDMSAHSTMLSLSMTTQRYHIWKQEQSLHNGQIQYTPLQNRPVSKLWIYFKLGWVQLVKTILIYSSQIIRSLIHLQL